MPCHLPKPRRLFVRIAATAAFAALVVLAGGCTSITARKTDLAQVKSGEKLHGVPFVMNKPRYKIVRSPGAPERFAATVEYVSDQKMRLTLDIDPGWLAASDFSLKFDENGGLTEANAKTTSETLQFVKAIGAVAGIVAGVPAAAGQAATEATTEMGKASVQSFRSLRTEVPPSGKPDEVLKQLLVALDETIRSSERVESFAKLGDELPGPVDPSPLVLAKAEPQDIKVGEKLSERLKAYVTEQAARDLFFYRNKTELAWLKSVVANASSPSIPVEVKALCGVQGTCKELEPLGTQIKSALNRFDIGALEAMQASVAAARDRLFAEKAELATWPTKDELACFRITLKALQSAIEAIAPHIKLAIDLAEMPPRTWQLRYAAFQAERLERLSHGLRVPPAKAGSGDEQKDEKYKNATNERARALGALPEQGRLTQLRERILLGQETRRFEDVNAEIAYLERKLNSAGAALKAIPTQDVRADAPMVGELAEICILPRPTEGDVLHCIAQQFGEQRPKYVVVLKPI